MRQLSFLFIFIFLSPPMLRAESERILAAEVNGASIYHEQVVRERRIRFGEVERELDPRSTNRVLIDRLIERELLFQQVTRLKLLPSKEEVIELLLKNKTSENDSAGMRIRIKELGISEEEFLQRARKDLAIQRLLEQEVYREIHISDEDVAREYESRKAGLISLPEIRLRDIFIPIFSEAGEVDARAEIERIRAELSGDATQFTEYARKFSHGTSKGSGGDLGYITKNQLPASFAEQVFALPTGQVSEVFLAEDGFHIFLLVDRRGGVTPSLESVDKRLREELLTRRREQALQAYLDTLKKPSKIIVYSQ